MKTFVSQRINSEEELRFEVSLSAARRASKESAEALKKSQEDNEALRIELAEKRVGRNLQTSTCMRRRARWPS